MLLWRCLEALACKVRQLSTPFTIQLVDNIRPGWCHQHLVKFFPWYTVPVYQYNFFSILYFVERHLSTTRYHLLTKTQTSGGLY